MSIEAIRELGTLASVCPELNMANYGEDDVRHLNDWAIEMSLLAEKVAAAPQPAQATQAEVTDAQIKAAYLAWCKTNGTPESFARAILALHPERVPMTREQRHEIIGRYDEGKTYSDLVGIILATEAHHGTTAQPKKEGA